MKTRKKSLTLEELLSLIDTNVVLSVREYSKLCRDIDSSDPTQNLKRMIELKLAYLQATAGLKYETPRLNEELAHRRITAYEKLTENERVYYALMTWDK